MAKKYATDAVFVTIDPQTLLPAQLAAYEHSKTLYREYKAAREAFENAMQEGVQEGERMVFGYNFGKLSVAIVPDDRKPVKAKSTQSLAEFLAAQAAGGRRT